MTARSFFYRETEGIRVTVRPVYLRDHSEPSQNHYVFAYFVRIENVGTMAAQLLTRRWLIHDSVGEGVDTEVIGEGVVGEQPTILPGALHEYQSFCILKSGEGWMEGHYGLLRQDGTPFEASIPRFILSASESTSLPS
jgi:ApaG protein